MKNEANDSFYGHNELCKRFNKPLTVMYDGDTNTTLT